MSPPSAAGPGPGGEPRARSQAEPSIDTDGEDADRHIIGITCEVAIASLDHVITPSLSDFLA